MNTWLIFCAMLSESFYNFSAVSSLLVFLFTCLTGC